MNFNKVILIGNLTRDPEVTHTTNNTAICELGLAVNRNYTKSDGEKCTDTCFVDITFFGKRGETIEKYCQKGSKLLIEGSLKFESWEAKDGGGKRSKLKVVGENFQFMGRAPGDVPSGATGSPSEAKVPATPATGGSDTKEPDFGGFDDFS
jgi:single-strand DNA-binding protein